MGLIGGMARTAVIAGTATATSNAVNRKQAEKNSKAYAEAQQSVAPAPNPTPQAAPTTIDPTVEELTQLADLKEKGIITEEEFDAKKKQILGI